MGMLLGSYRPAPDSHRYDDSMGAFVRQLVQFGVGTTYIGLALLLAGRVRWRDLGWYDLSLRQVALGAGGFLALFVAFGAFAVVTSGYTAGGFIEAITAFTWRERLLGLLIGVSASLVEESLYRGYVQPALCKRLGAMGRHRGHGRAVLADAHPDQPGGVRRPPAHRPGARLPARPGPAAVGARDRAHAGLGRHLRHVS